MQVSLMRTKIHRATITEADLNYEGSLTVDEDLMDAAGMVNFEKVHVVNITNGSRLITYLIKGERGSGTICLNGAAARLGHEGDKVIIIAYADMPLDKAKTFKPVVVLVDDDNNITSVK